MTSSTTYTRGDVLSLLVPTPDGSGMKVRPAIVVQADAIRTEFDQLVIVPITGQNVRANQACRIAVANRSADGLAMGLRMPSVVQADKITVVDMTTVVSQMGTCPPALLQQISGSLRRLLDL